MKERYRYPLKRKVTALPGDILHASIQDRKTKKVFEVTEKIERTVEVDTIITFDLDQPALGLQAGGIGAVFGLEEK
jgi:hypothetical protein